VRQELQVLKGSAHGESADGGSSQLLRADDGLSFYAKQRAPTPEQVIQAAASAELNLLSGEAALLTRALAREQRIEASERKKSQSAATGDGSGPRVQSGVLQRWSPATASRSGPTVLAGGADAKVTISMSRSIGDWDASRAIIPQPDFCRFEVAPGAWVRAVIASDGVWDLVSHEEAALLARNARSVDDAAGSIVAVAHDRGLVRLGKLKDDTTCLVVDLNPSQIPFEDLPKEAAPSTAARSNGGCCSLM